MPRTKKKWIYILQEKFMREFLDLFGTPMAQTRARAKYAMAVVSSK